MSVNGVEKRVYSQLKLVEAGGLSNICDGRQQSVKLEVESKNSCSRGLNNKSRNEYQHKNTDLDLWFGALL